jgi:hypothetical protein
MPEVLRRLLRAAAAIGITAVLLVLIFIAWWMAVMLAAGLLGYVGMRRLLRPRNAAVRRDEAPEVIEGEYRVEPEALPRPDRPER